MPIGAYKLTSTVPSRGLANLTVSNHDQDFTNDVPSGPIHFGSFSSVEGSLGKYALAPQGTWPATGGGNNEAHTSSVTNRGTTNVLTVRTGGNSPGLHRD
jgi:hypothetical protein